MASNGRKAFLIQSFLSIFNIFSLCPEYFHLFRYTTSFAHVNMLTRAVHQCWHLARVSIAIQHDQCDSAGLYCIWVVYTNSEVQ